MPIQRSGGGGEAQRTIAAVATLTSHSLPCGSNFREMSNFGIH